MRLREVLRDVAVQQLVGDPDDVDVTGVVHDSRAVTDGSLFCCVPGAIADGHAFAATAVEAGAVALLCERVLKVDVAQAVVPATRVAMGPAAAMLHGHPSRSLDVVGVTGTNGKTTTTHLVRSIFDTAGRPAETIGTLTGARTTPEAPDLQRLLAEMRDRGTRAVAMEVSSHALAQHRVDGTWFRVGLFTNLSRDHLDFHHTMDEYFEAKALLFTADRCEHAVVNVDDPWGQKLAARLELPWEPYSLDDASEVTTEAHESRCVWDGVELRVPLGGRFNLSNAIAAAVTARALGVDHGAIAEGLAGAGPVPGRFETVDAGQPFTVIVDYAHTPDGLERVLEAARELAGPNAVVVVFGSGGDRDPSKRAPMGEVASRLADRVVLTSDNPRGEDPGAIMEAVRQGINEPSSVLTEPDRRLAIEAALAGARPGDVVVIAGKGHETTQTVGDDVRPFDDRVVAAELLEATWSAS
ncbi:MAG TPA: UDP-N-acetylmuramoyl-L-alanyl-D-glutamate--2,6-diaminopimelate ligase [Acidimicrobiales bacterium]|jgi:UDP-N-acetylmuramoyl-L-alanyl-D-glutamate--2,6-diaminopimelate ligase